MRHLLHRFIKDQSGVTAIEYGLIASLVAVAIIASVKTLGTNLTTVFGQEGPRFPSGAWISADAETGVRRNADKQ